MFIERARQRAGAAALLLCSLARIAPAHASAESGAARPESSSADAASSDRGALAAAHFERGFRLARAGDVAGAIAAFEAAYDTQPNFAVLYNLGLAYAAVGRKADAAAALQRYLELGAERVPAERREQARALIDEYLLSLGSVGRAFHPELQPPRGRVDLSCRVPDVQASIDGVALNEALPVQQALESGEHEVRFRRSGYLDSVRLVRVERDQVTQVSCQLVPDPDDTTLARLIVRHPAGTSVRVDGEPHRGAALPPGAHVVLIQGSGYQPLEQLVTLEPRAPRTLQLVPPRSADALAREQDQRRHALRIGSYIAGGSAVAAGVAAAAIYLSDNRAEARWRRDSQALLERSRTDPGSVPPAQLDRLLQDENRIRDRDSIALGLSVLSGACLIAGAGLFWWSHDDGPSFTTTGSTASLSLHF